MRFGDWGARLSASQVADLRQAAPDVGIDTLDLADICRDHSTDRLVGDALRVPLPFFSRLRLVTKAGIVMPNSPENTRGMRDHNPSPQHLRQTLEATLRDLGADRVHTLFALWQAANGHAAP